MENQESNQEEVKDNSIKVENVTEQREQIVIELRQLHIEIGDTERFLDQSKKEIEDLKNKILENDEEFTAMVKKHNEKGAEWKSLITKASKKNNDLIYLGSEEDV